MGNAPPTSCICQQRDGLQIVEKAVEDDCPSIDPVDVYHEETSSFCTAKTESDSYGDAAKRAAKAHHAAEVSPEASVLPHDMTLHLQGAVIRLEDILAWSGR
eukprot:TRINITY_DN18462_c0_g1_i1.p1 TRINITY_DN18462_c0_g1~~TRINITY_DN18462_c0_g1_i1.p1  ORF type:complete len:102 (-),score=22.29 TRINITY_DN18462_c0_g1_i1:27-332(-)